MTIATAPLTAIPRCWRMRFVAQQPQPTEQVVGMFTVTEPRWAVLESVTLDTLLSSADMDQDTVWCVHLPGGAASSPWLERLEHWLMLPTAAATPAVVELTAPQGRLRWRLDRAVWADTVASMDDRWLTAVAEVAFYEGALRQLEQALDADWPSVTADIPLTHQVNAAALRRWPQVNALTERMTLRQMRLTDLRHALLHAPAAGSATARQLVSELRRRLDMPARLEALEVRLELAMDTYELANDRLSEYRYFRVECVVEIGVAILLLIEVVLMLWEIHLTYAFYGG